MSLSEFKLETGIRDPRSWALEELRVALLNRSCADVQLAMQVGASFGMDSRWVGPLIEVLDATWTESHEDAAFALGDLRDPTAVSALVHAATWVPDYLNFDEARSLAVKAIHSLGRIASPEAELALKDLLLHEDRPLRTRVQRVLDRRRGQSNPSQ